MKRLTSFLAAGFLTCAGPAAAVSIEGVASTDLSGLGVGDSFSITLTTSSDFPDYIGGVFSLTYDADVLTYVGIDFENPPWDMTQDQVGDATGASGSTTIADITFGALWGEGGASEPIGAVLFEAVGAGVSDIAFVSSGTGSGFTPLNMANPDFHADLPTLTATVTAPTPIPLPAGVWLTASGLAALGAAGWSRRAGV